MNKLKCFAYIIEFIIGFAPSLLLLALGVVFSPVMFVVLFSGDLIAIFYVALVFSGLFGFWGAISLLVLTLSPGQENTKPKRLKMYITLGVLSYVVVSYSIGGTNVYLLPFIIAPLFVTLHLVYIQRQYLAGSTANKSIN